MSVSPDTRASLGNGGLVLWEEDDKIAILSKSGYYPLALTSGAGKPTGTFEGLASQTDDCIAVFPYMESSYNSYDGSKVTVVCGDYMYQLAVKNNFKPYTCLMAGKINDKGNVSFKNLVSFVKLTTTFDCHEISIIGNDGEVLSGTGIGFGFDETGTPTDIKACYETSDIVTLSGLEGEKITAGTYYIGVMPQTLEHGFTLVFTEYDSNNEPSYRSRRTAKSVTFNTSKSVPVCPPLGKPQSRAPAVTEPSAEPAAEHATRRRAASGTGPAQLFIFPSSGCHHRTFRSRSGR